MIIHPQAVLICGVYLLTSAGAFVLTLLIEYPTQNFLHIYQNHVFGTGGQAQFEFRPSSLRSEQKNNSVKLTSVIRAHL